MVQWHDLILGLFLSLLLQEVVLQWNYLRKLKSQEVGHCTSEILVPFSCDWGAKWWGIYVCLPCCFITFEFQWLISCQLGQQTGSQHRPPENSLSKLWLLSGKVLQVYRSQFYGGQVLITHTFLLTFLFFLSLSFSLNVPCLKLLCDVQTQSCLKVESGPAKNSR